MCGIAGFASTLPLMDADRLSAMGESLSHRGPNDFGTMLWDSNGKQVEYGTGAIGMAHRRLSILDLSSAGRQPMPNESKTIWIVFNGEFYNFRDYTADLVSKGHDFNSRTDTEVLIHFYEEYGIEKTLARMNGMFAFALWDSASRKMILARDRLGQKPLYYIHLADGTLVYASEIKAFDAAGLLDRSDVDRVGLHQFWMYGYADGGRTLYSSVKKLPPAHYAVWQDGRLSFHEYWDCPFDPHPPKRRLKELEDELEALLSDAIRLRLIADVPVGLFLSGGIDSSLICAITAKVAGTDIQTFTISFDKDDFNEAPWAAAISRHLGLRNIPLQVSDNLQTNFEAIARHFDEPFGDSSSIPTFYVSKLARQHVTVSLTGDAGDELFGGYDAYAKGLRLWGTLDQRLLFARKTPWPNLLVDAPMMFYPPSRQLMELEKVVPDRIRKRVFSEVAYQAVDEKALYENRMRHLSQVRRCDLLGRMQYLNIKSYLPDDILVKVDRMSMAHGLECRSPFLDFRVVEFAARLPYEAKIDRRGRQKVLLHRLLERYVPKRLFDRPKAGFCVPWSDWCRSGLGAELRMRWQSMRSSFFNPYAAEILFPRDKLGWAAWQWNAFATMVFFESEKDIRDSITF